MFFRYRFTAWPEDALEKVAQNFLKQMEIDDDMRDKCVVMCKEFHTTVQNASARYYLFLYFFSF